MEEIPTKYEHIDILVQLPTEGDSWFDRISDFLSSHCTDTEECTCGLISMGGTTGTLDQCYDHMRISEKWAQDVLADDLKLALHRLSADVGMDDEVYERLRAAAYYHEDIQAWFDSLPDNEEINNE